MPWVTRRPHSIVALADSLPPLPHRVLRELAAAYLELLGASGGEVPAKGRLDVTRLPGVIPPSHPLRHHPAGSLHLSRGG